MTITGATVTRINAHGSARVFDISAGADVVFWFLHIIGGNAGCGNGGNIYNAGNLSLKYCTIEGGRPANGGGLANERTAGLVEQTADLWSGNSAGNDGGAIFSAGPVSLAPGSVFNGNVSGYAGGGIALQGGSIDLTPFGPAAGGNLPAGPDQAAATAGLSPTLFISNSAGIGGGGAIYSTGQVTLSNVEILSNTCTNNGGGIESYTGTLQISNALLAYNKAGIGGGAIQSNWLLTAAAISVISNTAGSQSGGLDLYFGSAVVSNSVFVSNTSDLGGAIGISCGKLRLDSSTVVYNQVSNGGGGLFQASPDTTTIVNSTFSGNRSTGFNAGGLKNFGSLTITSSSLVSNSAPSNIGNLVTGSGGSTWLHDSLVAFGVPLNCSGTITSTGYNLDSANTCHLHASGDLTNTLPLIGPLADNGGGLAGAGGSGLPLDGQAPWTHALLAGSPAINAADQANCPATDERGAVRPLNGCDIGAYEFGAKIAQMINFTLPPLIGLNHSPYPLGASASSGLVVSYIVSGAPCSLAGSNLLLNSIDACSVTAHQAGNVNYNAAADVPVTTTVGLSLFLPLVLR